MDGDINMGRQINYYMEVETFKQLVQKAINLGFLIIVELPHAFQIYENLSEIPFESNRYFFYLKEVGELITTKNNGIDQLKSPIIQTGYSLINEKEKHISQNRMWVSTGSWTDNTFVSRTDVLDKKYSQLVRFTKKSAPYSDIPVKALNPLYDGKKFMRKEYCTPYVKALIADGEYCCV